MRLYYSAPGLVVDLVVDWTPAELAAWVALVASAPPREPMNPFFIESEETTLKVRP